MLTLDAHDFRDVLFGLKEGAKRNLEMGTDAGDEAAGRLERLLDMLEICEPLEGETVTVVAEN